MCTTLKFAPSQTPEQAIKKDEKRVNTGEIVLFPGVRYERHAEMPMKKSAASDLASERDFLIL